MKDIFKKSILEGVIIFSTILFLGITYAAVGSTWTSPDIYQATSSSQLSSTSWNPVLANLNNLNTKVNSQAGASAWVNFDGTSCPSDSCVIRKGFNVSSVTRNATGDYTINFTTPMADANYAVATNAQRVGATSNGFVSMIKPTIGLSSTITSVRVATLTPSINGIYNETLLNAGVVTVAIFD